VPAIEDFEAGNALVFSSAVGKTYLLSESGTPDVKIIARGCDCPFHLARPIIKDPETSKRPPGKVFWID